MFYVYLCTHTCNTSMCAYIHVHIDKNFLFWASPKCYIKILITITRLKIETKEISYLSETHLAEGIILT